MDIFQNGKKIVYVSQDNYCLVQCPNENTIYYCDSATSCIILITTGISVITKKEETLISHLSRPGRFNAYFEFVSKNFGDNPVKIYASGANPPERYIKKTGDVDTTALRNASQVVAWLSSKAQTQTIEQVSLKLGQGNPAIYNNNLDCYSISFDSSRMALVSNTRVYLTDEQRDPTGGLQTLFCIYGDPNSIRNQYDDFSKYEIQALVAAAKNAGLDSAATMSDEEILEHYSSTPEYEVPWFCDTIRQAAVFVKTH